MRPLLFTPLVIGPVEVPNRIAIAPMCQYSAHDGCATDWHMQHWMNLAMSGAGLVMIEATGVERRGRITHGCIGLYNDDNERAMKRALDAARAVALPGTKFGIQLAHAGRKASSRRPWENGQALGPLDDPWPTQSASALPFNDGWHVPEELDQKGIDRIIAAFAEATTRACRLGFDVIEIHMTHGYLIHQFLSPLTNRRTDRWGGSAANRSAFAFEVVRAVTAAATSGVAIGARITGSDWLDGGLVIEDAVTFASRLREAGVSYACVSSGGLDPAARISVGPGYQVPMASAVKKGSRIVTRAVGMIVTPRQAEDILQTGDADQIALGRAILDNPRWGWHAAEVLGVDLPRPPQYDRARPKLWPGAEMKRAG
jgi:2,4-dienoyl-CoA reductase-like NADH-dependent reductase (Old Yellow Enzyme family)